jgi:DNA-binding NtrC family response regulator
MTGTEAGQRRILIVDDNVALAENLAELLGYLGLSAEICGSAERALASGLEDVVFLMTDLRLPGMDGFELVEHVRRARPDLRCVVISAHVDATVRRRARAVGASFFGKPVALRALTRLVAETLASLGDAEEDAQGSDDQNFQNPIVEMGI